MRADPAGGPAVSATCSAQLLNPLLGVLAQRNQPAEWVPEPLRAAGPQDRVPVELLHGTFERAVERLGDATLGLSLGRHLFAGEVGPLDYLVRSAPTPRAALVTAGRYSSLQADRYRVTLEPWRDGSLLRLVDEGSWPRPVAEMAMAGAYALHVGKRLPFVSRLECWLPYPAPLDRRPYEAAFPGATLCFDAPFHAFAFDASYERAPQWGADPALHALLRERFDRVLAEHARSTATAQRVRAAIEGALQTGRDASAVGVSRVLHMSRRTLSRRLQQEGTCFADEFDTVRRALAESYVVRSERPLSEIAYLLGFAHVESFHRAFKRWTGTTPLARRAAGSPPD